MTGNPKKPSDSLITNSENNLTIPFIVPTEKSIIVAVERKLTVRLSNRDKDENFVHSIKLLPPAEKVSPRKSTRSKKQKSRKRKAKKPKSKSY